MKAAVRKLAGADPVLARIIRKVGPYRRRRAPRGTTYFQALVRSIVYQQLHGKAAAAILERFKALYEREPFPEPAQVLRTRDSALRRIGLSRQKASYIKDIARRAAAGELEPGSLHALPDDAVVETLTAIKGIGQWTADMFLMSALGRPDVLPVGDYGIRKAVQKAYSLRTLPDERRLSKIAEPWRPHRSIACWYLWRSLDNEA